MIDQAKQGHQSAPGADGHPGVEEEQGGGNHNHGQTVGADLGHRQIDIAHQSFDFVKHVFTQFSAVAAAQPHVAASQVALQQPDGQAVADVKGETQAQPGGYGSAQVDGAEEQDKGDSQKDQEAVRAGKLELAVDF